MAFNILDYPETFMTPARLTRYSAWHGHIPFAGTIIGILQPRMVVELGSHAGDSYCAFCQAVSARGLSTQCAAVDTWRGDEHAGFYGEEIYANLRQHHDGRYRSFSQLIRMTFDEAVGVFQDGSIDLLHHDGLHTYESIRHDLDLWLPKLSKRGVLLIHDTAERRPDFGAWRILREFAERHEVFEFLHSHGLGVVAVGDEIPAGMKAFLEASRNNPDTVRALYGALGERIDRMAQRIGVQ